MAAIRSRPRARPRIPRWRRAPAAMYPSREYPSGPPGQSAGKQVRGFHHVLRYPFDAGTGCCGCENIRWAEAGTLIKERKDPPRLRRVFLRYLDRYLDQGQVYCLISVTPPITKEFRSEATVPEKVTGPTPKSVITSNVRADPSKIAATSDPNPWDAIWGVILIPKIFLPTAAPGRITSPEMNPSPVSLKFTLMPLPERNVPEMVVASKNRGTSSS